MGRFETRMNAFHIIVWFVGISSLALVFRCNKMGIPLFGYYKFVFL